MTKKKPPSAPRDLGPAGVDLWRRLHDGIEYEPHETTVVTMACRQADTIADLEAAIAADGITVPGAAGQSRLNACVTELRQCRLALTKILGSLALPVDVDEPVMTAAQRQAQKAANARWQRRVNLPVREA